MEIFYEKNDLYFDFEEEVNFEELMEDVAIYGNERMNEYGSSLVLNVIKYEICDEELGYDYDVLEELKKLTNKEWNVYTMRGYSQGDWQEIYYSENIDEKTIEYIENLYMGKVKAFTSEDNFILIPDVICWKGKEEIKKYIVENLGLDMDDISVMLIKGKRIVYDYE